MPNWLRALIAGYGAKKLGGGCFSTVLIFIVLYYVLGQCGSNRNNSAVPYRQGMVTPAKSTRPTAVKANTLVRFHKAA